MSPHYSYPFVHHCSHHPCLRPPFFSDLSKSAWVCALAILTQPCTTVLTKIHSKPLHFALSGVLTLGLFFGENGRVMVLAATNCPSELDEAILRHLPQAFEIGIPDQREGVEILKVILKDERVKDNVDFDNVAGLYEAYTGSDLFDLCKKAAYFAIRELLDEEKKGK